MSACEQKADPSSDTNDLIIKVYEQVCINIRTSDDISFKLMGLIPLISGTGAAILTRAEVSGTEEVSSCILLSFIAAVITFGLFKWELRNVQKCDWLVDRAAELEQALITGGGVRQFHGWRAQPAPSWFGKLPKDDPSNKRTGVGKTQAEAIIYWASIAAWLVPIGIAVLRSRE